MSNDSGQHSLRRYLGLLCHALTEVTGGEGGVALGYHPGGQVRDEVQALQGHNACSHEIARREERVLEVGSHRLLTLRDGFEVFHLYAEHDVKEQQDVKANEVWGMMRFRKSKQILDI